MSEEKITHMRNSRRVRLEFPFEVKELQKGYSDRILRIDLDKDEITILPVTQQMKDLWTGGKGFDLWLMFQEVNKNTKWDSPENPICFSPGPLGGATSFPGSGKTLVTCLSPLTFIPVDCNVGGYFGPYLKFAGFDVLVLVGKCKEETIVYIDAVNQKITIESAPAESIDSHLIAEELTEMYSNDDMDKRNIAVVSAGRGADYARMGVLNFSFWDWRRNVARLKQAGRGGVGTVFRNKKMKALVIKNRDITPAWRVEENKVASLVKPKKVVTLCAKDIELVDKIIEKWGNDPEFVTEMLQDIQDHFHFISVSAIDRITHKTMVPKSYLYHIATYDSFFSLEEKTPDQPKSLEPIKLLSTENSIVLANKQKTDYSAFKKALAAKNPESVIDEIKNAGLKCRGCGLNVSDKLALTLTNRKAKESDSYIICSVAEGHTNAAIGRYLAENNPQAIIESILLQGYAVGASKGYIVTWKDFTKAEENLTAAIEEATKKGFLGENIQGSGFSFTIQIHRLGGAFVPGEPTSVINAMMGKAGDSRAKYVPIEESGFKKLPTVFLASETAVNIPYIIEKGAAAFKAFGTQQTPGTKVFHLRGDIANTGLVEVPMGTSLKEVIEKFGGAVSGGKKIKAVQLGGPSGSFIPASQLDMKLDFDTPGTKFGTGCISVIADQTCIVKKTLGIVEYLAERSCGKCTPCREGLYHLQALLTRVNNFEGKENDAALIETIATTLKETSLCNFGVSAAAPVLSSLTHFKNEYIEMIEQKKCSCGQGN